VKLWRAWPSKRRAFQVFKASTRGRIEDTKVYFHHCSSDWSGKLSEHESQMQMQMQYPSSAVQCLGTSWMSTKQPSHAITSTRTRQLFDALPLIKRPQRRALQGSSCLFTGLRLIFNLSYSTSVTLSSRSLPILRSHVVLSVAMLSTICTLNHPNQWLPREVTSELHMCDRNTRLRTRSRISQRHISCALSKTNHNEQMLAN